MTAAYTVASEDSLVFEAQNTGAISVISPIADHVLLAVTGPEPRQAESAPNREAEESGHAINGTNSNFEEDGRDQEEDNGNHEDGNHRQIRTDLEIVSQELASVLREELAAMKWPDDI
ncbi:hypothetical protein A1O3_01541 [Capronia epimyces CBS 606.96]|uniref:Uncharacterized protein n=1 Tax=Capronia epimyces CBS 606.96 TaxID=1182542 RepID=W9YTJ6_9EURO|nr:uncharacterized protein A1O3_01541 [Capronia epimyces CBS 606.96]EXJ92985.1 hypothetical protein A1O3_01541 [Capronia epimyces CBS 606.96]